MGKSKRYSCNKKLEFKTDFNLRQTFLQRSPSDDTVKDLTTQRQTSTEAPSFKKIVEEDEIEKAPEIDKIENIIEVHDESDGNKTSMPKPVACLECVKPIQVFRRDEIKRGDHIKFHGRIYDHHAIVVDIIPSNEKDHKVTVEIVHASNTTAGAMYCCLRPFSSIAKLLRETKQINLKKIKVMVYKYSDTIFHFSPEKIVERANTERSNPGFKYNLFNNNCEHFATQCVTGESLSLQVGKIRMIKRLFVNQGFQGISDEVLRNKILNEKGMLCTPCFLRNKQLLSVARKPITSKDDLNIGDIITYKYYRCWHSAVVIEIKPHDSSLECKIAHYAFRGLHKHRKIREDTFRIPFNGSVKVTDFSNTNYTVYAQEEVVKRARRKLGEKRYVHFSNDSSHFARWCKLELYSKHKEHTQKTSNVINL
ncbi:uncharacterized protein [Mytilus edulis]|uniref:uncharacterized protein n=1 Tax=Mytilus edulis TaxID=6550 RepID=UPI0039F02B28